MLVFYSPDSLERLTNAQIFFIFKDVTFSVAPHPFKQLFRCNRHCSICVPLIKCQDTYRELFQSIVDKCHASNLPFNVQTLKMQSFVQLQLYLVATSTTRAVSTTWHKHHGEKYNSLVWCFSTRTTTTWLFCGIMDGLAFLSVPDLTNGIHLLRTLCPDDPPESAELLDYWFNLHQS